MADPTQGGTTGGGGTGLQAAALTLDIISRGLGNVFRDLDALDARAAKTGARGADVPVRVTGLGEAVRGLGAATQATEGLGAAVQRAGTSGAEIMAELFGATDKDTAAVKQNTAAVAENAKARAAAAEIPGGELPGSISRPVAPAAVAAGRAPGAVPAAVGEAEDQLAQKIATVIAKVEEQAAVVDASSARNVAAFKRNVQAAEQMLGALGADTAAYERLAAAMLAVSERAVATGDAAGAAAATAAGATEKQAGAVQKLAPQYRSAANGIAVLALAATQGTGSLQSVALAAGLAASSVAALTDSAKIAAWASGIGAAVTVVAVLAGVLAKAGEAAKPTQAFLDRLQRFGTEDQARAQLKAIDDEITRLEAHAERGKGVLARLLTGGEAAPKARGLERALQQLGLSSADEQQIATLLEQRREAQKRVDQLGNEDAAAAGQTRAQIRLETVRAENAAADAGAAVRAAHDAADYAAGKETLATYFADRVAAVRAGVAREVEALRAEQATLAVGPQGERAADRDARVAAYQRIETQIAAARRTGTADEIATLEERRKAEVAAAAAFAASEQTRLQALGQTDAAVQAQIKEQTRLFDLALAQRTGAATESAQAQRAAFIAALNVQADYATAQRELARVQGEIARVQADAEDEVAAGLLTEAEQQDRVKAAALARLPVIRQLIAELKRLAAASNSPQRAAEAEGAASEAERQIAAATTPDQRAFVQLRLGLAQGIADAIGGGIADGFKAALSGGGIGAGFKALTAALLGGLGSAMVKFGTAALFTAKLMAAIQKFLARLFPGGAVVAALAMIAAGATLQAAAGAFAGGGGGGGGGGGSVGSFGSFDGGGGGSGRGIGAGVAATGSGTAADERTARARQEFELAAERKRLAALEGVSTTWVRAFTERQRAALAVSIGRLEATLGSTYTIGTVAGRDAAPAPAPRVPTALAPTAAPVAAPRPFVFAPTIIGPADVGVQRQLAGMVRDALRDEGRTL